MRILTIFFFLYLLIGTSCYQPSPVEPPTSSIEIMLDLEDNQYFLEGQWHPMNLPLVGCTPLFNLHLDRTDNRLQLRYCEESGHLFTETITLSSNNCQLTPAEVSPPVIDHAYVRIDLLLNEDFIHCLQENNDLFSLQFDFD